VRCLFYLAFTVADLSAPRHPPPPAVPPPVSGGAWIEKRYENSSLAATIVREPVGDMDRLTRGIQAKA
jgi:hypothetical protein